MKKTFQGFKDLYRKISYHFSILCFSEDQDENLDKKLFFHLKNYNLVYQITNDCKGGALGVFFHKSICFKLH